MNRIICIDFFFCSDSWSFTPNRHVSRNDIGTSQSKHRTSLAGSCPKKQFNFLPSTAEGLECPSISSLKVTVMTKETKWTNAELFDSFLIPVNFPGFYTHAQTVLWVETFPAVNWLHSKASWEIWKIPREPFLSTTAVKCLRISGVLNKFQCCPIKCTTLILWANF